MRHRLIAVSVLALVAVLVALVPAVGRSSGASGIRELLTHDLVSEISADGAHVAVDLSTGLYCDHITVWSPLTGARPAIRKSQFCAGTIDAVSGNATLAGTRLLWQDGQSGNSYTGYTVSTADMRLRSRPAGLYSYEYTHDAGDNQYYGPTAGPFAGHATLLVFETVVEHVSGPATNGRLWRVDGRRKTLIHRGVDFGSLSVDGNRIAGAVGSTVLVLGADGRVRRRFHPPLRKIRVVVLQGTDLAVAGGGRIVVLDARSGHVEADRRFPPESRFQDYARGLAALIHGNSIHVFRVSDGKDVVVARPHGPGIEGAYVQAELEPEGLFYTYTTDSGDTSFGHVVFVPWETLANDLH